MIYTSINMKFLAFAPLKFDWGKHPVVTVAAWSLPYIASSKGGLRTMNVLHVCQGMMVRTFLFAMVRLDKFLQISSSPDAS